MSDTDDDYRIVPEQHPIIEAMMAIMGGLFLVFVLYIWLQPIIILINS